MDGCYALGYDEVDVLGVSFGGVLAQQLAHQAPTGCAGWSSPQPGPGLGGVPGSPRSCSRWPPPPVHAADYFRRIAGTIYGGAARRDPDAMLHGSLARFTKPPSLTGYLAQLFAITGWTSLPWLRRLRPARRWSSRATTTRSCRW